MNNYYLPNLKIIIIKLINKIITLKNKKNIMKKYI
jgi:hypothetical protein